MSRRDIFQKSRSSIEVAALLGTGTFALQIFGTFDGLRFTDVGPIAAVARACRSLTLDVRFLQLECVTKIDLAGSYVLSQAIPFVSFLFIIMVIITKKCVSPSRLRERHGNKANAQEAENIVSTREIGATRNKAPLKLRAERNKQHKKC